MTTLNCVHRYVGQFFLHLIGFWNIRENCFLSKNLMNSFPNYENENLEMWYLAARQTCPFCVFWEKNWLFYKIAWRLSHKSFPYDNRGCHPVISGRPIIINRSGFYWSRICQIDAREAPGSWVRVDLYALKRYCNKKTRWDKNSSPVWHILKWRHLTPIPGGGL